MSSLRRAVFLDRDGVLVHDDGFLLREEQIRLMDGVALALRSLKSAGMLLAVVSNQATVARGLVSEQDVERLNTSIADRIQQDGGPRPHASYFCPHHPDADVDEYRVVCSCRKPRPGMILRAAEEHQIDPRASFLVGDRMTDIAAGAAAAAAPCWSPAAGTKRRRSWPSIRPASAGPTTFVPTSLPLATGY